MVADRLSHYGFYGVVALLFTASAAITIVWCNSMSGMGDMPMPGGWNMSMAWMRMPRQTWAGAALIFMGMWAVMMLAMMLPSLAPMLRRYRQAVEPPRSLRIGWLTTLVGAGYFGVWILFGLAVYPVGIALAELEMRYPVVSRAVPLAAGLLVFLAGLLQFSPWKLRHLECCRQMPGAGQRLAADTNTAWRHGLQLGLHCSRCCAGLMLVLLVLGVMDLLAMAFVAAGITAERLAPSGSHTARGIGVLLIGMGLFLVIRATGFL